MELNEHGFLEELLALRRPLEMNNLFPCSWNFDYFDENTPNSLPNSSSEGLSPPTSQNLNNYDFNEFYYPFSNDFSAPRTVDSTYTTFNTPTFGLQDDYLICNMEEEELGILADEIHCLEAQASCKVEPVQSPEPPLFNMGSSCLPPKNRTKKLQGQPSKNLMAERRRRKRLNDRLSMLRSIVPKISKMDRTAILGDAIDYMKELLEKISNLQQGIEVGSNQFDLLGIFKDVKPDEFLVRNSPKFDVERRNTDTRIDICCAGKPGLLLSTVNTVEALGLEIQQCVISCFNDFAMQASCSERTSASPEEIKEALFRNAGYGGRCL